MAIRLQERDRAILDHLRRYRLSTPGILSKLFFDNAPEAMKSALKRLKSKGGFIAADKLFPRGNEVVYRLTGAGAVAAGLGEKAGHPTSTNPEDASRLLGQLLFCCAGSTLRKKLLVEEFEKTFPGQMTERLKRRFPYDCIYIDIDAAGERRLGRVIVDNGSEVVFRARKALTEDSDVLAQFVREGRYALAIVVPTEQKSKAVERQLFGTPPLDARGERLRVVVEAHEPLARLLLDGGHR